MFVLVFSFGNTPKAHAQDATLLQNLWQQLDEIRMHLGGLASRQSTTTRITIPTDNPSTASTMPCPLDGATSAQCDTWCAEIMDGTPNSDSGPSTCQLPLNIATPNNADLNTNRNTVCPPGQQYNSLVGCTLPPIVVTGKTELIDVTRKPSYSENLQEDRMELLPTTTRRPGMTGPSIEQMQKVLVKLGFLHSSQVTSKYDDLTKQGVMNFQKSNYLGADGVAGPKTLGIMRMLIDKSMSETKNSLNEFVPVQPTIYRYVYSCTITGAGLLINGTYNISSDNDMGPTNGFSAGRVRVSCSRM